MRRAATDESHAINVLGLVQLDGNISTRNMARQLDISRSSVLRILKKYRFRSYKYHSVQHLRPGVDQEARLRLVRGIEAFDVQPQDIMFTDEATFRTSGEFNHQNRRIWADENPHEVIETRRQVRNKINVWCGVLNDQLIGPVLYEQNMNAELYLQLILNETVAPFLAALPEERRRRIWYQHDGAPAHRQLGVVRRLTELFGDHLIINNGERVDGINWPARTPDATVPDFFLWGHVKERVYRDQPRDLVDLRARIEQEFREIPADMIQRATTHSFPERLRRIVEQNGGHFEHLL